MQLHRASPSALVLAVIASLAVGLILGYAVATANRVTPLPSRTDVLDGTRAPSAEGLADLARRRAALGANWLASVARPDGSFYYSYDPAADEYDADEYNEVRHAGATYALFQLYGASRDEQLLEAAEGGARYIEENSVAAGTNGRAYVYERRMKLGGQALALVALLERRRVLADARYDDLIDALSRFMLSLELSDEPGRYYQSYDADSATPSLEPASLFYPGEALLALTRLAQHFPDGPYLAAAMRAADYLTLQRDGNLPELGTIPREEHWLAIALSELHPLQPADAYRDVAFLNGDSMIESQHRDPSEPELIGASRRQNPVSYTTTATRGEAFVAVWSLAAALDDASAVERFSAAARRTAQFQMRVQYTAENTELFPNPEAAIGGWARNPFEELIRIDFTQHHISALIGVWHMTSDGDIPRPEPLD